MYPRVTTAHLKGTEQEKRATYTNFLIYEMSGELDLLGDPSDCEYSDTGVCVWGWVSLQLHVCSRLLIYALDVLTT